MGGLGPVTGAGRKVQHVSNTWLRGEKPEAVKTLCVCAASVLTLKKYTTDRRKVTLRPDSSHSTRL